MRHTTTAPTIGTARRYAVFILIDTSEPLIPLGKAGELEAEVADTYPSGM